MDLNALLSAVTDALRHAGDRMQHGTGIITEKDGAANLVTDTDIAIQQYLQSTLHRLLPEAGFLCEENGVNDDGEYLWVIDPIDGTTNFVRGIPECAVSVGLLHRRRPLLGAVYAPRMDLMFTAVRGQGAYCNGQPIHVSEKRFDQSLLCTALCLYQKELAKPCADILLEIHPQISDTRRLGSCALELCYLAMGRCDLYFEIRVYPWDYAAAYLILTEAGGVLKGWQGAELDLTGMTMLVGANNPDNYARLESIVTAHIPELPHYEE